MKKPTKPEAHKEEPKPEKVSAPSHLERVEPAKHHKPTFEPFEVNRQRDGSYITTWRHPNGELEQWHGDKRVYGPEGE